MATKRKYGTWGNDLVRAQVKFDYLLPKIGGFYYRLSWKDIETAPGVYDWTYFDTQLNYSFDVGIYVSFVTWVGPNSPVTWLSAAPYNVPFFTNAINTYPYYMNANYQTRVRSFLTAVKNHINTYPQWKKDLILTWQSAEGSTEDEAPYKGVVPPEYNIAVGAGQEWDIYKRDHWLFMKTLTDAIGIRLAINMGNAGGNYDWAIANMPLVQTKSGSVGHGYSLVADKGMNDRMSYFKGFTGEDYRTRSEFEDTVQYPWWQEATKQNFFAMVCSALHMGMDNMNLAFNTVYDNGYIDDPFAIDFYTEFAGLRTPLESNIAFCAFRDQIDLNDTVKYPVSTYGDVVTQNVSDYNTKKNNINSNVNLGPAAKVFSLSYLLDTIASGTYKYINPTRVTKIIAANPGSVYAVVTPDDRKDTYNNDYCIDTLKGNYQMFMTHINIDDSKPGWRMGPATGYLGRYTRSFDLSKSQGREFILSVHPDLSTLDDTSDTLLIEVAYLDSGVGFFSINCDTCKGKAEVAVTQKTNSNTWKTTTVSVPKFSFDNTLSGGNITIKYLSGDTTHFSYIKVKNLSKLLS